MANECIPFYRGGDDLPCKAGVALTGKKFVAPSAAMDPAAGTNLTVALPAAGGRVLGVAARTTPANAMVHVIAGRGQVVPVTAGAAITFNQEVQVDATGAAIPLAAGVAVGVALAAAASGADCPVRLY